MLGVVALKAAPGSDAFSTPLTNASVPLNMLVSTTDGAPVILGRHAGFVGLLISVPKIS
jgi:hypothetical protein